MLAPLYRAILIGQYAQTYGAQFAIRAASCLMLTFLFWTFHVLSPLWAVVWTVVYLCGEFVQRLWWGAIQPKLAVAEDQAEVLGYHHQLMAMSAAMANWAAAPCLLAAAQGGQNAVLGLILSAGCLLILSASRSRSSVSFLVSSPVAAIAVLCNIHALGSDWHAWLLVAFAGMYVLNAFALHRSNTASLLELISAQLAAEAANRTKRTFLATMSHEIRTPLNGVLGMAQAMELNALSPDQRQRLNVVRSSGETLLTLLNDLLDYSKIEAGKVEIEQVDFSLARCITDACQGPALLAAEKGLSFTVDVAAPRGLYRGDPVRVRQIVQNLVSNAIKFTRRGRVTVQATFDGQVVSIAITDTGIGISDSQKARLFSEFVQADGSTTRQFGGTGLGLAICRDLARLMGGDILVTSEVGMGSTFAATLPLEHVSSEEAAGADRVEAAEHHDTDAMLRVLVAEDNPANQMVLEQLLAHTNADAHFVENGELAVDAAAMADWDLILMDVQMPVMDGLTATREIRDAEKRSDSPRKPIYALTADAMSHQVESHRAAGMDGHLSKPIVIAELFALVGEISARKAAALPAAEQQPPVAAAS